MVFESLVAGRRLNYTVIPRHKSRSSMEEPQQVTVVTELESLVPNR